MICLLNAKHQQTPEMTTADLPLNCKLKANSNSKTNKIINHSFGESFLLAHKIAVRFYAN
jgi:hypothetical protein